MSRRNKVCKICGDRYYAKGLCQKHYYQNYRRKPKIKAKQKIKRLIKRKLALKNFKALYFFKEEGTPRAKINCQNLTVSFRSGIKMEKKKKKFQEAFVEYQEENGQIHRIPLNSPEEVVILLSHWVSDDGKIPKNLQIKILPSSFFNFSIASDNI